MRRMAAYCAVPRRRLHAQIAEALETHFPELIDTQPELFARHYAEAELVEKSVACWAKAGGRSADRSAMAEAAAQYQKGLDQLALLPDSPERQRQELEFHIALGVVLRLVKGYASLETGVPLTALECCGRSWVLPPSLFTFLFGSHSTTTPAVNWIWPGAWTATCCVSVIGATIPRGSFWGTSLPAEP
jgi:hypothetical protein